MGLFRGIMKYLVLDIFFLLLMMLMACTGVFLACHTPLQSIGMRRLAFLIMIFLLYITVKEECFPSELMFDMFAFFLTPGIVCILGAFVVPFIVLPSFIVFSVMALALFVLLFAVMKIQDADLYFHYRYNHGGLASYFMVVQGCALLAFYYLSKAYSFYPNVGEILRSGGIFAYVRQNQPAFFFVLSFLLYAIVHLVYLSRMERCLFLRSFKEHCSYPQNRKYIRKVALRSSIAEIRTVALGMLPYPEEKETLRQMALQDADRDIRKQALAKLSYSEEKETIRQAALRDKDAGIRRKAVEQLPYPEEAGTLRQIALHDADADVRSQAFTKLSYSDGKETIRQAALRDKDAGIRSMAVERLPYPEEAETLRQIALHDVDANVRSKAFAKLPYPEEKETIRQAALRDKDAGIRRKAVAKLPYPEEAETLRQIALHDADADVRSKVLTKLPYPEEKEAYLEAASFYESFLGERQERKYQQKAAGYLIRIYRIIHSGKKLQHIDIPHHDWSDHTDEADYDCYWEDHADQGSSHTDKAHDDYFLIEAGA